MTLPLAVKSNYYKGLLVISRRDRVIDDRERQFLLSVGEILGFEKRFCENTIDELLQNPHVSRNPIVFSDETVIECFFRDALRIANLDSCIHPSELRWLQKTAQANGKSDQWLKDVMQELGDAAGKPNLVTPLEIQKHL